MRKVQTSGLGLALKLIIVSHENESENNKTIRNGVVKMLESKMREITFIDEEEVPVLIEQINKISAKEPIVAEEVLQLIKKFHPNL
ncbi:MAG: hypothetical protein IJ218_04760 [Alphaproteobacteria bacterium]|nr:hypothetical protein [Alphaproteobacteria bacterium]